LSRRCDDEAELRWDSRKFARTFADRWDREPVPVRSADDGVFQRSDRKRVQG
jgi:hypothetical protein